MSPALRKYLSLAFKLALSLAFIWFVNRAVSFDRLRTVYAAAATLPLVLSAIFGLASLVCQEERWRIILRAEDFPADPAAGWRTFLAGALFGFITPGRTGEFFRGVGLAPGRTGDSMFAVLVDKLYGLSVTMIMGLAVLPWYLIHYKVPFAGWMQYFVGGAFLVAAVALFVLRGGRPEGKRALLRGHGARLFQQLPRLLSPAGRRAMAFSIAAHLLLLFQAAFLLAAFGGLDIAAGLALSALAFAAISLLPISIGNMGVREGMFTLFMTGMCIVPAHAASVSAVALSLSMAILVVNILVPAGAGLCWLLADRLHSNGQGLTTPSARQGDTP